MSDFSQWQINLNKMSEIATQLAEARADLSNMDNIKRTVVAMAMKASGETTAAAQEREAYCSEEYQQWCREHYAALKAFEGLRLRLGVAQTWFTMAQSEESSRREEMRLAR